MPLLRSLWDAAHDAAPERAGAIDDGRRVGYDAPEELGAPFARCGIADVATAGLDVGELVERAELKGASPLMEFAGDGAATFTY